MATLEYFYKYKRNKDGLTSYCKECLCSRSKNEIRVIMEIHAKNEHLELEDKREKIMAFLKMDTPYVRMKICDVWRLLTGNTAGIRKDW